jgi:chemotaxis family two-component system sensor kinase Cph1
LPPVLGNEEELLRLFQNLIGNAIKYHGEESPEIQVSAASNEGEWVFSVKDNGIGVDPKYHCQIFGTFQRLHSSAEYEGSGLGLATCKRIVQRHGGRIWIELELGKGSIFHFTLPKIGSLAREQNASEQVVRKPNQSSISSDRRLHEAGR